MVWSGRMGQRDPRPQDVRLREPDYMEVLSSVMHEICSGLMVSEVQDKLLDSRGIRMTREAPYEFLRTAARKRWVQFDPPGHVAIREAIKKLCRGLTVEVVHTNVFEDVANVAADHLLDLLAAFRARPNRPADEVHIGFAGGHAMRKLAAAFARLLRLPHVKIPKKIVFHAMVSGFDVHEPSTDPNAFFAYFFGDPNMQVETAFVGHRVPPIVRAAHYESLRNMQGVREAYKAVKEIDIIVTSAGCWEDEHSLLREALMPFPETHDAVVRADCIGDMLWQPVSKDGIIEMTVGEVQTMTLLKLRDLPGFIDAGGRVLLVIGPCGGCGQPKEEITRAILNIRPRLITDLIVDSRSTRWCLPPRAGD